MVMGTNQATTPVQYTFDISIKRQLVNWTNWLYRVTATAVLTLT